MESVGRMTRSRAKALGTTPMANLPTKTPEPRTTGRRRKGAAQAQEQPAQEAAPKQLQFSGEAAASEQSPTNEQPMAAENGSDRDVSASASPEQVTSEGAQGAGTMQLEADTHAETHDNPSVLMASPIILTGRDHHFSTGMAPVPVDFDQAVAQAPAAQAPPPQPEPVFHAAQNTPTLTPSAMPTTATSSLPAAGSPLALEFDQAAAAPPFASAVASEALLQPVSGSPFSVADDSPMVSPLSLAASPLPTLASPQMMAASPLLHDAVGHMSMGTGSLSAAATPLGVAASPLPAAMSPMPAEASPLPVAMSPMDASPFGAHMNQGAAAPSPLPGGAAVQGSPFATITPLSFTSDAPRTGAVAFMQPLPASIPASPLSLTEEAVDQAVFSPMPEDLQGSPISLSGGSDLTPQPMQPLQPQLSDGLEEDLELADDDDEMMADTTPLAEPAAPIASSPLTFASDRRAATPGTAPSPAPAFVGAPPDSVPHASASPAPAMTSFQGFAAVFPTPAGSELEPGSPSLAGLMTAAASVPSPSTLLMSASADAIAPSPSTITIDRASAGAATGSCMDQPASVPSTALATPTPGADANLSADTATAQCTTLASPMDGAFLPPAPAPTPESGAVPGWTLTQTPLANALAMSLTANAEDTDKGMEAEAEADEDDGCQLEQLPLGSPVEDMDMEDQEPQQGVEPFAPSPATLAAAQAVPTPAAVAKTPSLQMRSPAIGSVLRAGAATPKTAAKAATPVPVASVPRSSGNYINVESRYNKTPTTGSTAVRPRPSLTAAIASAAASTPVAPTNAAAGAKSVKRVSIHTPEGPRSVVPLRQVVVPTPFRPKSVPPSTVADHPPAVEPQPQPPVEEPQQPLNPQAAAAADERRAKASERLKAIHATEQAVPVARAPSGPGYLASTQTFAVKSVKSKMESASYDPRSLRQLKREVKEAVAKKEAKVVLNEARSSKLTPKVQDRQLPMPDDNEGSDDQAEYNEGQENDLVAAMTSLEVAPEKSVPVPLRGLPAPQGRHLRFNDKGKASESPQRTVLRGLPVAVGKYKRFD